MNIGEIAERMGIDSEFFLELVGDFLETATEDMAKMDAAVGSGNADDLLAAAHSVKGAAGSLNLKKIADAARKVEATARGGRWDELEDAIGRLRSEIDAVTTDSE